MNTTLPAMPLHWHWLTEDEYYVVDSSITIERWLQELPEGAEFTLFETVEHLQHAIDQDVSTHENPAIYERSIAYDTVATFSNDVNTVLTVLEHLTDNASNRRYPSQAKYIVSCTPRPEIIPAEPYDIQYRRL